MSNATLSREMCVDSTCACELQYACFNMHARFNMHAEVRAPASANESSRGGLLPACGNNY